MPAKLPDPHIDETAADLDSAYRELGESITVLYSAAGDFDAANAAVTFHSSPSVEDLQRVIAHASGLAKVARRVATAAINYTQASSRHAGELTRAAQEATGSIPTELRLAQVIEARDHLRDVLDREPSHAEIAARVGIGRSRVQQLIARADAEAGARATQDDGDEEGAA